MIKKSARTVKSQSRTRRQSAPTTLGGHLQELKGRLFSTVLVFLLAAGAAYPFFDKISAFIMAPLQDGQELVYLTPSGALAFIITVCLYVGAVAALPVLIFHLYRFIMPAVEEIKLRRALAYTATSFILAIVGILYAYYLGLPAALHFLTGFDINHISSMLTVDSYFSFVMTYLLAGAILFQMPIIMLIINRAKPLTPAKLMNQQGKVILGAFIAAAVISPTPDAVNQTLLAAPVVIMYQLSIMLIWLKNRGSKKAKSSQQKAVKSKELPSVHVKPIEQEAKKDLVTPPMALTQTKVIHAGTRSLDGFVAGRRPTNRNLVVPAPRQANVRVDQRKTTLAIDDRRRQRSVDGISYAF